MIVAEEEKDEQFARRLERLMAAANLSQAELSRLTGISPGHISKLLAGERGQQMHKATRTKLAQALGVRPVDLFVDGWVPREVHPDTLKRDDWMGEASRMLQTFDRYGPTPGYTERAKEILADRDAERAQWTPEQIAEHERRRERVRLLAEIPPRRHGDNPYPGILESPQLQAPEVKRYPSKIQVAIALDGIVSPNALRAMLSELAKDDVDPGPEHWKERAIFWERERRSIAHQLQLDLRDERIKFAASELAKEGLDMLMAGDSPEQAVAKLEPKFDELRDLGMTETTAAEVADIIRKRTLDTARQRVREAVADFDVKPDLTHEPTKRKGKVRR